MSSSSNGQSSSQPGSQQEQRVDPSFATGLPVIGQTAKNDSIQHQFQNNSQQYFAPTSNNLATTNMNNHTNINAPIYSQNQSNASNTTNFIKAQQNGNLPFSSPSSNTTSNLSVNNPPRPAITHPNITIKLTPPSQQKPGATPVAPFQQQQVHQSNQPKPSVPTPSSNLQNTSVYSVNTPNNNIVNPPATVNSKPVTVPQSPSFLPQTTNPPTIPTNQTPTTIVNPPTQISSQLFNSQQQTQPI